MLACASPYDLVIVGGGPAAAIEAVRSLRRSDRRLIISKDFGGTMNVMGPVRLQSYLDELVIGQTDSLLLSMTDQGSLSPTGQQYASYVRQILADAGIPLLSDSVEDVWREDSSIILVLSAHGAIQARQVILATGVMAKTYQCPIDTMSTRTAFDAFEDLSVGHIQPYRDKSVVIVGAGNSAMQIAARMAHVARDVTILANKYVGMYPQENSDRFAWRASSQLTCELIAKTGVRCRNGQRGKIACVRYIVYDELLNSRGHELAVFYRSARNNFVIGRYSMPHNHPHLMHRIQPTNAEHWREIFVPDQTVVVSATGVSPRYPAGSNFRRFRRDSRGYLVKKEDGSTEMEGLYVAGGCAGFPAVNQMHPVLPDNALPLCLEGP